MADRPIGPTDARSTLAASLGELLDEAGALADELGIRPYRVSLVWLAGDGEEPGEGVEAEVARLELRPPPVVSDVGAVSRSPSAHGLIGTGTLRVERISTSVPAPVLSGACYPAGTRADAPSPASGRVRFLYEVADDGRTTGRPSVLGRFRLTSLPSYRPGVGYSVTVERVVDPALP